MRRRCATPPRRAVSASGPLTVRELMALLQRWPTRVLAGERGLSRTVSWAGTMRARLPAFAGFQGGELALLSLATLRSLRSQLVTLSLARVVDQLAETGVAGIAVAGLSDPSVLPPEDARGIEEAKARAEAHAVPLLALPAGVPLPALETEIIAHVVARRERQPAAREAADPLTAQFRASLRGEALDALISGTYASDAQMSVRARQLGHDLAQPHSALWVELRPRASATGQAHSHAAPHEPDSDAAQLAEALDLGLGAWSRARGAQVVALAPLARLDRGTAELAERVEALLTRTLGANAGGWSAGLGDPGIGPAQARRSAMEAHDAARLGLMVLGPRRIAQPADLGVYRLLLTLRDAGELEPFVKRVLAPFEADRRMGEQLLETIEAFLACNGNREQAAERLSLHRNSLLYRLNRARDLLGYDPDDVEARLALQLALKGRRVLALSRQGD